jgi:hypothetical protein
MARDTREHFRPNFFSVVKCKDEVGSPFLDQNAMRSALPCGAPSCSLQGHKYPTRADGRPFLSCCGKDLRESWDRLTVFYPIRKDT